MDNNFYCAHEYIGNIINTVYISAVNVVKVCQFYLKS